MSRLFAAVLSLLFLSGCAGPVRFNPEATPPNSTWRSAAGQNLLEKWDRVIQVPQKHVIVVNNLGDRPLWVVNHLEGEHHISPGQRFRAIFKSYGDHSEYEVMVKAKDRCGYWVTDTRTFQSGGTYGFREADIWEINYLPSSAACRW